MSRMPAKMPRPDEKAIKPPAENNALFKQMQKAKQDTKELQAALKKLKEESKRLSTASQGLHSNATKEHAVRLDACKIPAPPAPFAPIPYPNIAKSAKATDGKLKDLKKCEEAVKKASEKVTKILDKQSADLKKKIKTSSGDEAGTLKGIVSVMIMDKSKLKMFSSKVMVQGKKAKAHVDLSRQASEKQFKIIEKQAKKKR